MLAEHRAIILEALDADDRLSERDMEFVESIADYEENDMRLTPKQVEWLEAIGRRLDG